MATWSPISNTTPQYYDAGVAASGFYLKFYQSGTTTPTNMATDSTGGTTLDKCQINSEGYPINGSSAVFIPHIDQKYKLILYRNATDADNNTTANAAWEVDALIPVGDSSGATYTPEGTGAQETNVETRFRETHSIIEYDTVQNLLDSGTNGKTLSIDLGRDSVSTDKIELNETYQTYIDGYGNAETILSFTNTDSTQCISIPTMDSDRYHAVLKNFKVQGGATTGDGIHANTPTIAPWIQGVWVRDCSGSGKAGLKMTDSFIGRIDDVKAFSNDIGIDLVNTKGIAGSGSWVSDNVSWGMKLDEDCVGNDIQLTELGLSTLDINKQALYINGKSNRIGCLFYENFTAPRAIDLDSKSLGNVLDFVHSSPLMVWDDGSFNVYPMDNDAPLVNLNSGFYFGGHSVACGDLENQFIDSTWQDGVTSLRFSPFGATAPTRSHETALGYLDDNSLKLDWGTTALSGVESSQTFSVTDGDNVAIMMMIRADRDFGTDENLIVKILGAGNENRATLYVSDFRANIWRPVFLTYRATATESVTIGISLVAATTHTALVTYVDDVVFAVNKRTIGLLRNDTTSTVVQSENQGALIPKGVFNTAEVQVATNKARVGGRLTVDTTQTGTTAVTSEETLASFSLPAYSIWENAQGLKIRAFGTTAANANNKRVRIKLGSTTFADTASVSANNNDWEIEATIIRTGEATQKGIGKSFFDSTLQDPQYTSGTEDFSTALTIAITGQNGTASANDIVIEGFIVEVL